MHRLLPLLLLVACEATPEQPFISSADASCDVDTGTWLLEAEVDHDADPASIQSVFADAALYFPDPTTGTAELEYIGSVELERDEGLRWAKSSEVGETPLQCGFDGDYHVLFVAEDTVGRQAAAELVFDGFGDPL